MYKKTSAILFLALVILLNPATIFAECGDINNSGDINILDVTNLISYLYKYGSPPADPQMADVNHSGNLDILDITYLIQYLYKSGPAPNCPGYTHLDERGDCLTDKYGIDEKGTVIFDLFGNDLRISHLGAHYNCCLFYYVYYDINETSITAYEYDYGQPCDCICYFDLTSTLFDIEPGEYEICLVGIYGDTLSCQSMVITGDQNLIDYTAGECEMMKSSKGVEFNYSNDTLTLLHYDAFFNCGAIFQILFEQAGDTLRFMELNISEVGMYCMCYFDLTATVINIPAGNYIIEIWQRDYAEIELALFERQEILLE
ncbi:MAG: dockerin type I repeat-containing protein [Candidatus Zixiibacteriota bacterium]